MDGFLHQLAIPRAEVRREDAVLGREVEEGGLWPLQPFGIGRGLSFALNQSQRMEQTQRLLGNRVIASRREAVAQFRRGGPVRQALQNADGFGRDGNTLRELPDKTDRLGPQPQ